MDHFRLTYPIFKMTKINTKKQMDQGMYVLFYFEGGGWELCFRR